MRTEQVKNKLDIAEKACNQAIGIPKDTNTSGIHSTGTENPLGCKLSLTLPNKSKHILNSPQSQQGLGTEVKVSVKTSQCA